MSVPLPGSHSKHTRKSCPAQLCPVLPCQIQLLVGGLCLTPGAATRSAHASGLSRWSTARHCVPCGCSKQASKVGISEVGD